MGRWGGNNESGGGWTSSSNNNGNGGRDVRGADWDLCTTLEKTGKCSREGCKWRHSNAEFWEGSWWQLDDEGRYHGWWKELPPNEECPVSLNPISMLDKAPFELKANATPPEAPRPGALPPKNPTHRFDAEALAKYLVGSGQFMNPVNRRPLLRSECQALDKATSYAFGVTDAFAAVASAQGSGGGRTAAAREIAVAARQLFVMPSAAAAASSSSSASAAGGRSGQQSQQGSQSGGPRGQRRSPPEGPLRDALTVHAEGGLRVVDDNEGEDDSEDEDVVGGGFAAPTPAEALSVRAAPKRYAPRPRAQNDPRGPLPRASDDCGSSSRREPAPAPQPSEKSSSSSSKPAPEPEPDKKSRLIVIEETSSSGPSGSSSKAWVPEGVTPEMQAPQLEELSTLCTDGVLRVLEDGAGHIAALRTAQAKHEVLARESPITCEAPIGDDAVAQIGVPPYYPTQSLIIIQVRSTAQPAAPADVLRNLEKEAKQHLRELEEQHESRPLTALTEWLSAQAVARLLELEQEHRAAAARQETLQGQRGARGVAEEQKRKEKEELDAQAAARVERNASKYSPSWDLCTAFVKNGKCKNKNCKWRHEKPDAPPPADEPTTSASAAAAAAPAAAAGKAAKNGKSKK